MKKVITIVLFFILSVTNSFSQEIEAHDNAMDKSFTTTLPDTVWIAVGSVKSEENVYLDWSWYYDPSISTDFVFLISKPRIIEVPYRYGFSAKTERIVYERRIDLEYVLQVYDYNSIQFLIDAISNGKVIAILLNEEGNSIDKDDTYNFGFLDTHEVTVKNGSIQSIKSYTSR